MLQVKNTLSKLVLATALFLTVGIASSFAAPAPTGGIGYTVNSAFHKDFANATVIDYKVSKDYTRLTLKMTDVIFEAFYNDNGDLLAVSQNIRSSLLPVKLLAELRKNYGNCWISDLFQLTSDDQSNYYITLENADSKITLKSSDAAGWELYKKTNKD